MNFAPTFVTRHSTTGRRHISTAQASRGLETNRVATFDDGRMFQET